MHLVELFYLGWSLLIRQFKAYFRTGDIDCAEQVRLIILDNFPDIQSWKDMERFYVVTENGSGLISYIEKLETVGYLDNEAN